ncbi:hypothetical protein BZG36_03722 [Bifiguratus adelaidae]|uniref:Uncharacterized protein n=1 Tax=Bifiguratus adelaidae TaxID=1938954 RepID=A0A261XZ35_9FUNG|nr:hypothetical protein BZG36_03722 [Bifiguratus adelaidae]
MWKPLILLLVWTSLILAKLTIINPKAGAQLKVGTSVSISVRLDPYTIPAGDGINFALGVRVAPNVGQPGMTAIIAQIANNVNLYTIQNVSFSRAAFEWTVPQELYVMHASSYYLQVTDAQGLVNLNKTDS